MPNPFMSADYEGNVFGRKDFFIRCVFGSSVLSSYKALGVQITRTGTGTYRITFDKVWDQLIAFRADQILRATGSAPLIGKVTSKSALGTSGYIDVVLEASNTAGTATDPAATDEICFVVVVSDDRINYQYGG